jgi:hypothetical protein
MPLFRVSPCTLHAYREHGLYNTGGTRVLYNTGYLHVPYTGCVREVCGSLVILIACVILVYISYVHVKDTPLKLRGDGTVFVKRTEEGALSISMPFDPTRTYAYSACMAAWQHDGRVDESA